MKKKEDKKQTGEEKPGKTPRNHEPAHEQLKWRDLLVGLIRKIIPIILVYIVPLDLPAQTYLINQNLEGTGYDNSETWTESAAAAWEEDYTTIALRGSQSLHATNTGATFRTDLSPTFANKTEVWVYFMFRLLNAPSTTTNFMSISTTITQWGVNPTTGKWYIKSGGTANKESTASYAMNTTYYIWLHYKKGTGANGILQLYVNTDGIKPSTPTIDEQSGGANGDATNIRFATVNNSEYVIDWILVDDEAIGTLVPIPSLNVHSSRFSRLNGLDTFSQ